MKSRAPKLLLPGFQLVLVMNEKPWCRNAGHALLVVLYAINAKITSTSRPATRATTRNVRSVQTSPVLRVRGFPAAAAGASAVMFANLCGDDDLRKLRRRLLLQRVGERRILRRIRERLPV